MKQTAVIKYLRYVQTPILDCLYAVPSAANLSFRAFVPIAEQMDAQGGWADSSVELDEILENGERDADPLLVSTGPSQCEVAKIDGTMPSEMRQTKADQAQETQVSDPLLKMVGTLECEVTDIGERHDDYIGDALLAELQEDE